MLEDLSCRRRKEILHGNGPASDRAQSGGKEEKESCYSAGRLLVTRGKSLIWPPAALISPSQLSFSSLTLHIGPFLVLIVTPFFTLDVFFVLNHGLFFWLKQAKIKLHAPSKTFQGYLPLKNCFICCDTVC